MLKFIVLGMVAVCAGWSTTALGQYKQDYEKGFEASKDGVDLHGQQDYFNPLPDESISGKVYTYKDNALGLPDNPNGGKNFVGSPGPGGGKYSRTQKLIEYGNGTGEWTVAVDIAVTFTGQPPSAIYIGSFSTVDHPAQATYIYPLGVWVDNNDPDAGWNAMVGWFNAGGTRLLEPVPDAGFQNLKTNHWYHVTITFDLDSNKILGVTMFDLETERTAAYEPPDRFLSGGEGGGLPTPTGFRYFGGTGGIPGNTTAWDNLAIISEAGCVDKTKQKKAKCKNGKVKARIKRGEPGGRVVFVLKDAEGKIVAEQAGNVNNKGKSAAIFRGVPDGDYTVEVCSRVKNVTCK